MGNKKFLNFHEKYSRHNTKDFVVIFDNTQIVSMDRNNHYDNYVNLK